MVASVISSTKSKLAATKQFIVYILALWARRPPNRSGGI